MGSRKYNSAALASTLSLIFLFCIPCNAQLSTSFYDTTCPDLQSTVKTEVRTSISAERRMAGSLIRLHFHDCFVQGCDASILLDDSPTIQSEKSAPPNRNSVRGFDVIDRAKTAVEKICPGVVSCADILSIAARDATVLAGGPIWTVKLGRRDSTTTNFDQASNGLPFFRDNLQKLIKDFSDKGFTIREMVALSGAHSFGQAQCFTFRDRIYNNASDIDAGFASTRRRNCPSSGGDGNLAPLDLVTSTSFDNNYYKNIIQKKGLLETDQILLSGGSTDDIVRDYSNNPTTFKNDFASAMAKMSDLSPLTGTSGVIRKICSSLPS
ncbi:lignin-forming anionic peroxidase-like [Apium graveolens]|uniref:lignin-forming anionic peroxidase-like n=1 Tax=Apium graveolens TaxID=4045 RepID=UPI003D7B6710